jgi:transcriptional activator SPT8
VLNLARDEKSVLSGSWDKTIHDWDLNTGQIKRTFTGSGGQISAIEMRPLSSLPVPETSDEQPLMNGTLFSDSADAPRTNGLGSSRKTDGSTADNFNLENGVSAASPVADSLFGGNDGDSLFGDNDDDNAGAPSGGNFGDDDDDDEFSRAIANGLQQQEDDEAEGDVSLINPGPSTDAASITGLPQPQERPTIPEPSGDPGPVNLNQPPLTNGLPHSDEMDWIGGNGDPIPSVPDITPAPDSTFLAASIDGTIRVWDKRKLTPAAKISPRNVPPWCMGACWSPDGNFMYAGRRNGTVEEFSLHKGLRGAERTFKFPQGSGAVSAVRAMPNGRHLIWCVLCRWRFWQILLTWIPVLRSTSCAYMIYNNNKPSNIRRSHF